MYLPGSFSVALLLTIMSTVFWGSWANTYKGTRNYPFALFYWDYIVGVVLCSFLFAFTLGSFGSSGQPFFANLRSADPINWFYALLAGAIFNVANLLLVAAIDMAGLAIAFPVAIGIAVVEGVVLSYALQPVGSVPYLGAGVILAVVAVLFDAQAYRALSAGARQAPPSRGIFVSVLSGILMGAFAPFVTRSMTHGNALSPYSVAALFSLGALFCCAFANTYMMKHPVHGAPVSFSDYPRAGARNHVLGVLGGVAWAIGTCFNFIAAGFLGVPISYAIGQSAPLIAAAWGVLVWHEFRGASSRAWTALALMAVCYVAAIVLIARAYKG
jgi:glucose uptake protein